MQPRLEVFLSHSTQDQVHVALVQRQIEALGIQVYLAEHDPQSGTSIAAKVEDALRRCHAVVVLITETSINSNYVQQEIGLARAHQKLIVPIVERSVDKTRLGMLAEVEWLELDLSNPTEALARMTASLQPLLVRQIMALNVSLNVPSTELDPTQALVLVGVGLLLGLLIAYVALGKAPIPPTV
jgi:hypothetical protein